MPKINAKILSKYLKKEFGLESIPEHRFHPERKWRFDLAIPSLSIAIEFEGGTYTNGRHTRGKGFIEDCNKYNAATLLGWRVFRYTHVGHGYHDIINMVRSVLEEELVDCQNCGERVEMIVLETMCPECKC